MKITMTKKEAKKLASIITNKVRTAEIALNKHLDHIFNRAYNEGTLDEFYDRRTDDEVVFKNYDLEIRKNGENFYALYQPDGLEMLNETETPLHKEDVDKLYEILKMKNEETIEIEIN